MDTFGKECARARESVSADLDRELQELDQRRLQAHLRVCADCSAWEARARATTAQLRDASLEAPPAVVFEMPRRARRTRAVLVAAPAAALAASVVFALGVVHNGLFGNTQTTSTSLGPTGRNVVQGNPGADMDRLPTLHRVLRAI
jgi:predicted anti-sigma-YlaC factor YlaD